jgi:hypothetical protein
LFAKRGNTKFPTGRTVGRATQFTWFRLELEQVLTDTCHEGIKLGSTLGAAVNNLTTWVHDAVLEPSTSLDVGGCHTGKWIVTGNVGFGTRRGTRFRIGLVALSKGSGSRVDTFGKLVDEGSDFFSDAFLLGFKAATNNTG